MTARNIAAGEGSRLSGLTAGVAVGLVGLLVGLSLAFATGTQTEQYATDAELVQASGDLLTVSAITRADLGVVLVLARSAQQGLVVNDLPGAIREFEANGSELTGIVTGWAEMAGEPSAVDSARDLGSRLQSLVAVLRDGDVEDAETRALTEVLPALEALNRMVATERNEAAGRLVALRTSAGTLARVASLGVALLVPGIAFFVFRGTMRRRQRNAELQLLLDQERELVKTKDEFVANLSHELRTPLTGIFGFAMVLDDMLGQDPGELDIPVLAETTGVILSEASELNRMVDDLLTAAKQEGGSLTLVLEELDVATVIETSIDLFRRQNHRVTVDCEPAVLTIDRHHLGQLVRNLVSNATKHGGPAISIEGRLRENGYAVSVRDDGPGVPDELVDRLFSRFVHQGDAPLTTGSVGLGLFIASMLAETMGGELSYERDDGWSVFEFTLPVKETEKEPSEEADPAVTGTEAA